jgi:predicted nucleotidyltransferase
MRPSSCELFGSCPDADAITMKKTQKIKKELIDELVKRILNSVLPNRIILFGSAAKGRMGANSDIDLLVIMPDEVHRRNTARVIYRSLSGLGFAKDIVVVTESDILKYGDNPSLVIYPALREGVEVYRAA